MLFAAVVALHVLVWAFVLLAWVHPRAAAANVLVVVPGIYVLHALLPVHVLETIKAWMRPSSWKRDSDELLRSWVVPGAFVRVQEWAATRAFMSPVSPQGMLVIGSLTSCWALMGRR